MNLRQQLTTALVTLSLGGAGAIVAYEGGYVRTAYRDPVGVVTVCAGHTKTAKMGQVRTEAECEALLREDVKDAEKAVKRLVKAPLTQNQYDAVVSFVFNVGSTQFASSTLLKKINANDCWGAGAEFPRWVLAKGTVLPGLVIRRASERKQFETGCASGKYTTKNYATPTNYPSEQARAQARRPEFMLAALLAFPTELGMLQR